MDDDKVIYEKIAKGLEWLDSNYAHLDETAKAAFDDMTYGVTELIAKYGYTKGVLDAAKAAHIVGIIAGATVGLGVMYCVDKMRKNYKNPNKANGSDS